MRVSLPAATPSALLLRARSRRRCRGSGSPGRARRRRRAGSTRFPFRGVCEFEGHGKRVNVRGGAGRLSRHRAEIRLLEERIALDVLHEIRDRVRIEPAPFDGDHAAAHVEAIEPHQIRQVLADLVHDAHRPLLALLELIDQIDALLQAVLALLVILDFLDDRLETLGFGVLDGDGFLLLAERALLPEPPTEADQQAENDAAGDEDVVQIAGTGGGAGGGGDTGSGSGSPDRPPFPHQVDLDQASPNFLMARPTAIAMLGPTSASSSGLNSFSSTVTFENGSITLTGMPNLSRRMASRFSTPDPPPARTISSTRSAPEVAVKKSSVFRSSPAKSSLTELRMGMTCWMV